MYGSLIHIAYQTADDQTAIQEVLEQEIPSATRVFGDAKRAAEGIMVEFNLQASKNKAKTVSELNDYVFAVQRYFKDMSMVYDKVAEILDQTSTTNKIRLTVDARNQGAKLLRQIESYKEALSRTLNEHKST
jgi:hypothetical protein